MTLGTAGDVVFDETFAGVPVAKGVSFVSAAVLPGGRRLLAAGERGVALLDADGTFVHRFRVPATALAVHDDGASAIAVRRNGEDALITRIDLRSLEVSSWGERRIMRFCRSYGESGWTVLSGDELQVWDVQGVTPRLLAATPLETCSLCGIAIARARASTHVVVTTETWGSHRSDFELTRRIFEGTTLVAQRELFLATAEAGGAENRVEYRVDGQPPGTILFREPDSASMIDGYQRLAGVLSFRTEATVSLAWDGLEGTGRLRVVDGERLQVLATITPMAGARLCASDEREGYLVVADSQGRSATLQLRGDP